MPDLDAWNTQLRKGVVQLLVLQLLSSAPLYGYGIVRRLEELGDFVAGEGTVYPVLRRLEADGLLSSEWVTDAPGNPRRYYAITPAGRGFLGAALAEWDKVAATIHDLGGDADAAPR